MYKLDKSGPFLNHSGGPSDDQKWTQKGPISWQDKPFYGNIDKLVGLNLWRITI